MRKDLLEVVADSLDAPPELLEHLPELFAGLEDLGARATDIVALAAETGLRPGSQVLDLGCGKGASALALAKTFGCRTLGIDAMPAFVAHATARARREGVADRCQFVVGDIRDAVSRERGYDLVMMLALGEVLGALPATLDALANCAKPTGYVLLDDAYLADDTLAGSEVGVYDRATTLEIIQDAGMRVAGERTTDTDEMHTWLQDMTASILAKAEALATRKPELAPSLRDFARRQVEETQYAMGPLVGVTWLLQCGQHPSGRCGSE
jgi:cyclopropane fatty-acyl-phospholipid synthase-like methyltransferase